MSSPSIVEEADAIRAQLHGMWASVAPSWGEHADYVDARAAQVTEALLALAEPRPGDRVLELASGAGGLGLAAAPLVAPSGEVVLSDVAAEMVAIAAARAQALGVENASARVLDLEAIDEADGSYDVVLCREGLMFAVDPERAGREIARVLRPGGRVAIAVWGPRERNPWLGVVMDTVSAQLGAPVPPPGVPHPFALADADRLDALLTAAGLADVVVSELDVPLRAPSVEDWWARTTALAGPLARMLAQLPEPAAQALATRAREAAGAYATPAGLEFPGVTLLASARR
jgi:ubiquinone/menaquinone biosynthesis C-methylase UbiE